MLKHLYVEIHFEKYAHILSHSLTLLANFALKVCARPNQPINDTLIHDYHSYGIIRPGDIMHHTFHG